MENATHPATEPHQEPSRARPFLIIIGGAVLAIVLLFAVFADGDAPDGNAELAATGEFAGFIFLNADGTEGSLADYAGQPLVVNFFAAWCGPCRAELPEFEQVSQTNLDTVRFLGISHDLDEVTWRSLVQETGITFDTAFQPGQELFEAFDAKGMPTTAFVSANGEVVHVRTGVLTEEKLQELIDEHLVEA